MHSSSRGLAGGVTGTATTGLYDLWLNSMLPTVGPSMVTGVTSSSSHQINSERLAEKLLQLCIAEKHRVPSQRRAAAESFWKDSKKI